MKQNYKNIIIALLIAVSGYLGYKVSITNNTVTTTTTVVTTQKDSNAVTPKDSIAIDTLK